MHPQRLSLIDQVASDLRAGIEAGKWAEWLPQERVLARELFVSRATLRMALKRLRTEGLVEGLHHRGNRILAPSSGRRRRPVRQGIVNLIVPGINSRIPRAPLNWMDELRAQLAAKSCQLRVLHTDACYLRRPDRALEKLVLRDSADCWLVRLSTLPMQEWLEKRGLPVILCGTSFPDIKLPYIDVDRRAMARHAAGVLVAAGHRRIAFLRDSDLRAGDIIGERGFMEAMAPTPWRPDLQGRVIPFEASVAGMIKQLNDLMFRRGERPTALMVSLPNYCYTIWSHLGAQGMRVPADVSVIAQFGTPDLSFLVPEPAHYRLNVTAHAEKIMRLVLARIAGDVVPQATLVVPNFVRGASVQPLSSAAS